jgi:hypothetical protein
MIGRLEPHAEATLEDKIKFYTVARLLIVG